jgi:hypothetical protein
VEFYSFATGKVKTVAVISISSAEGLSVSSDGCSILFSQFDEDNSELVLVREFPMTQTSSGQEPENRSSLVA